MSIKLTAMTLICSILCTPNLAASTAVDVSSDSAQVSIENKLVRLSFSLNTGTYSVYNKAARFVALKDAMTVVQPGSIKHHLLRFRFPPLDYRWAAEPIQDEFGTGQRLTLTGSTSTGYVPDRILQFSIYDQQPQILIGWGIHNQLSMPVRIQEFWPMYAGQLFTGHEAQKLQILRSGSGGERNYVVEQLETPVVNGLMATYQTGNQRHSLVVGGARYHEFIREVRIGKDYPLSIDRGKATIQHDYSGEKLSLKVFDPYGKRIEAGETYISPDTSYLDVITQNPFLAYERYGTALQRANKAKPNLYNFPTLCGWSTSTKHLGNGVPINNSEKLVQELDQAVAKGLTNYFKPGVRLEPDTYIQHHLGDTEQGWWSDETLRKFNHLSGAYDTWEKFAGAINRRGGVAITYSQASIPSLDFAQEHPEFLIHNDNSLAFTPYFWPFPMVGYDYSDPGFQQHFLNAWKKIGDAGIHGVKIDYPASSWETQGGFEDRSYTTTRAYRKQFELLRQGLGPEATLHEQILGGNDPDNPTPITDATAGVVDLQRVWRDSSHIEPEMVSRIGLRWYKNRKVYSYYEDTKNFYQPYKVVGDKVEILPLEERQTILTLSGFLSGKLDLATSYTMMSQEVANQLSKIYPVINERKAPRPVDMLLRKEPTTYVYDVTDQWSQVMLINPDTQNPQEISAPFSGDQANTGSLGLKPGKRYHVFDFWNQQLVGTFKGTDHLSQQLQPMQALIYAVREVRNHPQVLSTDRHFMQGLLELSGIEWDADQSTLSGSVKAIANMPLTITIAANTRSFKKAHSDTGTVKAESTKDGLVRLILTPEENTTVSFEVLFE